MTVLCTWEEKKSKAQLKRPFLFVVSLESSDIFTKLKTKKVVMDVANEATFEANMLKVYETEPHVAHSKCMQMKFMEVLVTMTPKKQREFMTDMVFLAAKKGKRFGPFGKLY